MNIYIVLTALSAIALVCCGIMIGRYIERKYFSIPVIKGLRETNQEALKVLESQHQCLQNLRGHITTQVRLYQNQNLQVPANKHLN